jgi:competence protein ComEC
VDPGTTVMLPFLARRGIEHIDLMVLSHQHPDHALGLVSVARALPVYALWQNGADAYLNKLVASSTKATLATTPAILGTHEFHGATIDVLAPAPAEKTATYPELEANDNSLVLRICYGADCALWPGDVEAFGEDLLVRAVAPDKLRADVVKAPHHGSKTSSTDALVKATGAKDVLFCTGRDNTFGFPSASVMDRWRSAGARLWDTADDGEIAVTLTGHGVVVRSFLDEPVHAGIGNQTR